MRQLVLVIAGLWLSIGPPAMAQSTPTVVVELFTSQGCSSCPPADKLLGRIATEGDVITLALHVDYWDYIGWKDTFARPSFTQRQYDYADAAHSRTVYTPQFVIGGADHVVGNRSDEVADAINRHRSQPTGVTILVQPAGNDIRITASAENPLPKGARILVFHYLPEAEVAISRGENAGRTITYHNIVTDIETVGDWAGDESFTGTFKTGSGPLVAVVQERGTGPILAAARYP